MKRETLTGVMAILVLSGVLFGLILLILVKGTVYELHDLVGPSEESTIAEWTEFCEEFGRVGTTYSDFIRILDEREVIPRGAGKVSKDGTYYSILETRGETVSMQIRDMHVRHLDPTGDAHMQVYVRFDNRVLSICNPSMYHHGR